jgi:hypothetical protein
MKKKLNKSEAAKKRWLNLSEEERLKRKLLISNGMKEYWSKLPVEERNKRAQKRYGRKVNE